MAEKKKYSLLRNFIAGVIFVAVMMGAIFLTLRLMTQHSVSVEVPDLVGQKLYDAKDIVEKNNLQLVVTDSVYVSRFARGCVYAQNPKSGERVKRGRKIYLTVNATKEKQVTLPDLVGLSMRQAKVELNSRSLHLGRLNYVPDMATNNVLAQTIKGVETAPGTRVDVGTTVDLTVGLNPSDGFTVVPDFTGMQYQRAVLYLQDNCLNLSAAEFDKSVKTYADSLKAFVYKQRPDPSEEEVIMGSQVRLYLTLDEKKLPVREDPADELEKSSN